MAYVLSGEDEDKDKLQGEDQGKALGAESGVITGDEQKDQGATSGTGNYTNLQSYIDQNKPAKFGEQFSGRVGEDVTSAEDAQKSSEEAFRTKVDASAVAQNKELVKEATETPYQVVQDQDKLAAFRKQRDASYSGPKNLSDEEELYSKAYNPTNLAQSRAKQAVTGSGKKALLKEYYGAPAGRYDYSGGQQNLDSILIGMDPNARGQLEQQQGRAKQAGTNFDLLNQTLGKYGSQRADETAATSKAAKESVGGARTKMQTDVQSAYDKEMQSRAQRIADEKARLGRGEMSSALANRVGLSGGADTYGVNAAEYFQEGAAPTISEYVSPEQQKTSGAYDELVGAGGQFLPYADLAGKYNPTSDMGFDTSRFNADIAGKKGVYDNALYGRYFGTTGSNSGGGATYSGSPYYVGGEQVLDQNLDGNTGVTSGSLMDNLNTFNTGAANNAYVTDPKQANAYYQHQYDKLNKALAAAKAAYGADKKLRVV